MAILLVALVDSARAEVTLHAVPDFGHPVESMVVQDDDLHPVGVAGGTLSMPASAVNIPAEFGPQLLKAEAGAPRFQSFAGWTGSAYEAEGIHIQDGWIVQNARIAAASGAYATPAARLSPTNSALVSPDFADGVGQVSFWACTAEAGGVAHLLLQSSGDGGSTWSNCTTFSVATTAVHSAWLQLTNQAAAVRLVFDPLHSSQDVLIDNVDIRTPAPYLVQNFDGWPVNTDFQTIKEHYQGWAISNCVVSFLYVGNGQVARMNSSTGSYIRSPEMPHGMGELSFSIRKFSASDPASSLQIQVSSDGVNWQAVAHPPATTTEYRRVAYYLGDASHRFVRLANSTGVARILIDDIRISALRPRPTVDAVHGFDPPRPLADQPATLLAQVVPMNGAEVLSATGYYRLGYADWVEVPLTAAGHDFHASAAAIPGQPAGTLLRSYVRVQYAGAGADPTSSSYATQWVSSAIQTNLFGTQAFSRVEVLGDFVESNELPLVMRRIENTALWELEHAFDTAGEVAWRMVTDLEDVCWGAEEDAPVLPLPAAGVLVAGSTRFARVTVTEPGTHVLRFNSLTGEFSFHAPGTEGYYAQAHGLSGVNLRQALRDILSVAQVAPGETLEAVLASIDVRPDGTVWDMYSDNPGGVRPYEYTFSDCMRCGYPRLEGDCYQISYGWPIFRVESVAYGYDIFTTFPIDGQVNQSRWGKPLGEVANPTIVFLNGGKVGPCAVPGYAGEVYEPIDAYKGDLARAMLYGSTRYLGQDFGWPTNAATRGADLDPWLAEMLVRWHGDDPVSAKELARNEAACAVQGNRNPFIDHPEWVSAIWGTPAPPILPCIEIEAPASLLTSVEDEVLTIQGQVSAATSGRLVWSNQLSGAAGSLALDGTNFVLANVPLVHGQNLIHLSASNSTGQAAGRTLVVFRRTGARDSFDVDAKWQGMPACPYTWLDRFGALKYRPGHPQDPAGYFESPWAARAKSLGMAAAGYSWVLGAEVSGTLLRYRTPLTVMRFSVYLAPFTDSQATGFEIRVSTNSGQYYETLLSADASWFNGERVFRKYEMPPMELVPEPRMEVFIEIRKSSQWEIVLDDFDCLAVIDPEDTDGDYLPDVWEIEYFGDLTTSDGRGDTDGDRLKDPEELALGTDPTLWDTDGDELADWVEVRLGTNPLLADSDGDGLNDKQEFEIGTHPLLWDTDDDGQSDRDEYIAGTDWENPGSRFAFDERSAETGGPGGMVLRWETVSGRMYRLFRSERADGDWGVVEPLIEVPGDGSSQQFTNDSPDRTGFFRLTVDQP